MITIDTINTQVHIRTLADMGFIDFWMWMSKSDYCNNGKLQGRIHGTVHKTLHWECVIFSHIKGKGVLPIDYGQLRSINLNGIYRDFAELPGMEITLRVYQYYKGLQVTFPTRLLDRAFVEEQIRKVYNGTNVEDLARKYGYSEHWVRKILNTE